MSKINKFVARKIVSLQARKEAAHEEGQGLAEYGLILALVALACVAVLGLLGTGLAAQISAVTAGL